MVRVNTMRTDTSIRAADRADLSCRGTWRRTAKGNLWRPYDGLSLTIFRRADGSYSWCIATEDEGPRYSTARFETEDEAIDSLCFEVVY
jgi:hypothetical protein